MNRLRGWWKQFCYNRMADVIECAASSESYKTITFLCLVINHRSYSPFKYMARSLIMKVLSGHSTLRGYLHTKMRHQSLDAGLHPVGYFHSPWVLRREIHKKFWTLMVKALREGNADWGKTFDIREIIYTDFDPRGVIDESV